MLKEKKVQQDNTKKCCLCTMKSNSEDTTSYQTIQSTRNQQQNS